MRTQLLQGGLVADDAHELVSAGCSAVMVTVVRRVVLGRVLEACGVVYDGVRCVACPVPSLIFALIFFFTKNFVGFW